MTDILIHKSAKYIEEDLDYYCSDIRDKHNMIKPKDGIISLSCDSNLYKASPTNSDICSPYYPFAHGSFDRIYLGISFPLFANNWGAAFLRHLMYLVNTDGAVILPVYAERQGVEKNYWSRSSLEVMFQSRQKWWGMSNIWAENDGVMSMRIGKKEPPKQNSTFNYLFDNVSFDGTNNSDETIASEINRHHCNGTISAIVEQIIINFFGRTRPVTFCDIKGSGLLTSEILMSDYINIKHATQHIDENGDVNDVKKYISNNFEKNFSVNSYPNFSLDLGKKFDVITIIDSLNDCADLDKSKYYNAMLNNLNDKGILIVRDKVFNDDVFIEDLIKNVSFTIEHSQYSSIVATKHNNKIDIAHYSDIIFNELQTENKERNNVFNILYKK